MDLLEAMKRRHSVRQYAEKPIEKELIEKLEEEIELCNREGDLHIQLVTNEPKAFTGPMAHYGKFTGVSNYFAMVGKKCDDLDEKIGYYGERLVLFAQSIGLHTCWVALTYQKVPGVFKVEENEKFTVLISVGYGRNRGLPRKTKSREAVSNITNSSPTWFRDGVDAALLAPTAMNQQKFRLTLDGSTVYAKAGLGFYTKMDLGIVKYHFELGAGKEHFRWG